MIEFSGIWPILYAVIGPDGQLDREALRLQVEACVKVGAPGIAVLGLATEVHKLTPEERETVMCWAVEDLQGRAPLAVTVAGPDASTQQEFAHKAQSLGASWMILQPPSRRPLEDAECLQHFDEVMAAIDMPLAIQNAREYLGVGLSLAQILELRSRHPHFVLLKGEGPSVEMQETVQATGGALRVFNGRGGLELTDSLRAGCSGIIPAPELVDRQLEVERLLRSGQDAEAEAQYREILPAIVFVMQSIPHLLCYGKRILAHRLGLDVFDREPFQAPTEFGLERVRYFAEHLGPLPH